MFPFIRVSKSNAVHETRKFQVILPIVTFIEFIILINGERKREREMKNYCDMLMC